MSSPPVITSELYGDVGKIRREVYKSYNTTEEDVKKNVATLKKWCEDQPHLPEVPSDSVLESFLILNELSVEKTKPKVDMYYTVRSSLPDVYERSNPKLAHMQRTLDVMYFVPLSATSESLHRIGIFKLNVTEPGDYDPTSSLINMFNQTEIRLREDSALGDILIVDMEGMQFGHFVKLTPIVLAKMYGILETVFSARVAGIHFFNATSFVEPLVKILKAVVNPFIGERIYVHKDFDGLLEHYPKEIFPKDYGGNEKSLQELREIVKKKLLEYQPRFDLLDELRVNESLRPKKSTKDGILGLFGNFKQLGVD